MRKYLIAKRKALALNSIRPILGAIKFFYRVTVPRDWATLAAMRLPKSRTVPKVLPPEHCWKIIEATDKLYLRVALRTAYTCGLRNIDIRHLRPRDVCSTSLTLTVAHSKGRHQRCVPIPLATIEQLREYWVTHRNPHWLFPSRGSLATIAATDKPIHERSLQRGIEQVVASLGWAERGIVLHTLRHSYATAMLEAGVNLKVLSGYLGHKNLQATEIYLHLTRRSDEQAREIVAAIMNSPIASEPSQPQGAPN